MYIFGFPFFHELRYIMQKCYIHVCIIYRYIIYFIDATGQGQAVNTITIKAYIFNGKKIGK